MNWEDECFLLSKSKFRENANIINIFSKSRGKVSGLVYGGNSRKIKNYLQIGNRIYINHKAKSDNKIGYFQTELIEPISPKYFDDKIRSCVLISLCSILNTLLPESQPNKNIYNTFENFLNCLDLDNWIILYIFFELSLLKELGYDPNLSNFKPDISDGKEINKIKIDNIIYEVPTFLISNQLPKKITNPLVIKSLYFTRNLIQKRFFIPYNLIFPKSRVLFENYFNLSN